MATQFTHPAEHIESVDTSRFECIDGQLIERPLTTVQHSLVQHNLSVLLHALCKSKRMAAGPELSIDRTLGSKSDWMTPDFAVSMPGGYKQNPNGHALPPVSLLVEVLSAGQTMVDMEIKAQRYFDWGAYHVWLIDPLKKEAVVLQHAGGRIVVREGELCADPDFCVSLSGLLDRV